MTMVRTQQNASMLLAVALVVYGWANWLPAQTPPVHFQHAGAMPPGAIGHLRLQQGGPLPGYFQPVEIRAPKGARISLAREGQFEPAQPAPVEVGMLIAPVYRLRVTNIPRNPGEELYPTIEIVDRLYPPVGETRRFPIPIDLTQEELELAISGRFVTRVIYLEEPTEALPRDEDPEGISWFEARSGENPLEVADRLGRPMAILRIGSRQPDAEGPSEQFLYGCPPLLPLKSVTERPAAEEIERP